MIDRTPDTFIANIDWAWPRMEALDEVAHQNAAEKRLRSMLGSYREELGPNWRDVLATVRNEIDWCKKNNLPHPAFNQISGGERTGVDVTSDGMQVGL